MDYRGGARMMDNDRMDTGSGDSDPMTWGWNRVSTRAVTTVLQF